MGLRRRAGLDCAPTQRSFLGEAQRTEAGMNDPFDPKRFAAAEPRTFADLRVGEVFRNPSRTVTAAHFAAFQLLAPVYVGDTLYPELVITALIPQRTTGMVVMAASIHNQRSELVLAGEHKYLLRKSAG